MTTRIKDIRDGINALIVAQLPNYIKLPDGIDIEDNANIILQNGFRVAYGPGNYNGTEWCNTSIQRLRYFSFALTNYWASMQDGDSAEAREDSLMADWDKVVKSIHSNPELVGENILTTYVNDNGLEYMLDNQEVKQYILIVTTIAVDYYEGV